MFDIGWPEILVVAVLTLLVVGPRDLPVVLRTVGKYVGKLRALGRDFSKILDDAAREADLEDVVNMAKTSSGGTPRAKIEKFLETEVSKPLNSVVKDIADTSNFTEPTKHQQND